jgi:hypothetical protein
MSSPLVGHEEQYDMKQISMRVPALLAGWLFIMPVESLSAAEPQLAPGMQEKNAASTVWSGPFHEYSRELGKVWVNDRVFLWTVQSKVIGTATKLGLVTAIKRDEEVTVLFEDAGNEGIPQVIEIRRH